MEVIVREYRKQDIPDMIQIWNQIVEEANAFPQEFPLSEEQAQEFFARQSFSGVAEQDGEIVGLYILHPNNVGRCGHISNASYAVKRGKRGNHIGEFLVRDCIQKGKELGFRILQFNAVVATNTFAIHLYEKLGFQRLGTIPGGFRMADGSYEDIIPFYLSL
jgi:L-amino acid N-acyltransferase YncA